jgi:hypothetical protein
MAKRTADESDRNRVEIGEDKVEEIHKFVDFDLPEPVVQKLVLLKDVKLIVPGPVSGNVYTFHGAGSVVDVDTRDIDGLLEKSNKRSCCGVDTPTPYFSLVGG